MNPERLMLSSQMPPHYSLQCESLSLGSQPSDHRQRWCDFQIKRSDELPTSNNLLFVPARDWVKFVTIEVVEFPPQ